MKSVLHEASSIIKAIEKAWEASGKPSEFNVKVLEQGEKKFWIFTSRPAIVSMSFDPRYVEKIVKNHKPSVSSNRRPSVQENNNTQEKLLNGKSSPQFDSVSRNNPRNRHQQPRPQHSSAVQNNQQAHARTQQPMQQRATRPVSVETDNQAYHQKAASSSKPAHEQPIAGWTPELTQFVSKELKNLLTIMGINILFQEEVAQKTLTITFAKPPLDNKEDARLLYISLSYLLIQLTKKQEKKKLREFHLIITAAS